MDKRTILFIILVGLTFVGLNFFFSYQRDEQNRQRLTQLPPKETGAPLAALNARTARLTDLPLLSLYQEAQNQGFLGYGIQAEGALITLAWNVPPPSLVYAGSIPYTLVTQNPVKGGVIVYTNADFQTLPLAALPEEGVYDVQVVLLPAAKDPEVLLGVLEEGKLRFPGKAPSTPALVLYKSPTGWLPLGYYTPEEHLFILLQDLPLLNGIPVQTAPAFSMAAGTATENQYYVLENGYMQLVFSAKGGALAEINLPFEGKEHPHSVVKEIGFDRDIAATSPDNARFPSRPYYSSSSKELHSPGPVGGYYPLIRRQLGDQKTALFSPRYYALNVVSEFPETAELMYTVKEFSAQKIVLETVQPHRKITKTFTLPAEIPYCLDMTLQIEGDSRGLWLTSGIPEVEILSNNSSPQIQYRLTRKGKGEVEKLDLPKPKEVLSVSSIQPDWVANSNGYLGVILDPAGIPTAGFKAAAIPGSLTPTRLSLIDPIYRPYPASKYPGYEVLIPLSTKGGTSTFRVYAGPFEESILKKVDTLLKDPLTGDTPDYSACWTFYGWFSFISEPFAKLLFVVMKFFHGLTHSWGFSIILLTVFLRLLLYPLNAWSFKSMRRMQQLSPQIQAIQQKYKKEPKKAQTEIMALYRGKKVNPFTGCVPILIQIPFLIAMFDLLKSSFQLRGAGFIPGWIDNLTAPDVVFQWKAPIFFIGNQFHLLPLILGGVMFFQQKFLSTAPKDPSKMTDQQRQQRAMGTIMSLVFMVMFYHFPSGLNLYWLSSMLLGILQQWFTNRMLDKSQPRSDILEVPVKKLRGKKTML